MSIINWKARVKTKIAKLTFQFVSLHLRQNMTDVLTTFSTIVLFRGSQFKLMEEADVPEENLWLEK